MYNHILTTYLFICKIKSEQLSYKVHLNQKQLYVEEYIQLGHCVAKDLITADIGIEAIFPANLPEV